MKFLELRSKLLHWKVSHSLLESEIVRKYGDIKAWYREYRNIVTKDRKETEEEVNWFITPEKIIRMKISSDAVEIKMWHEEVIVVEKNYWNVDVNQGVRILRETTLLLSNGKLLTLPGPSDKEFIEQYETFIEALEVGIPESRGFIR